MWKSVRQNELNLPKPLKVIHSTSFMSWMSVGLTNFCTENMRILCEANLYPRISAAGSLVERILLPLSAVTTVTKKIIAPLAYKGSTDSTLFEFWFEHMLLKAAPAYSVFVMDNASFHRKTILRELASKANCEVLFLPPYSPDLNPIEKFWAWLKLKLRSILHLFSNFNDAIMDCF